MAEVRVERWVSAPMDVVWTVLSDFDAWGDWNEVMFDARSKGGLGARIDVKVDTGWGVVPVKTRLTRWAEGRELAWGARLGPLLDVEHGVTLEAHDGGTRVIHFETFRGLLGAVVVAVSGRKLTARYALFLDALARRVES